MGDGIIKQPAEQAGAANHDVTNQSLAKLLAAAQSEQTWANRKSPYQSTDATPKGIVQAQAGPDASARIGLQGTDGAPVLAPVDRVAPAAAPADKPPTLAQAPAGSFHFNPETPVVVPPPTLSGTPGKAKYTYDVNGQIGPDPVTYYGDGFAKIAGTAMGWKLNHERWKPILAQKFDWREPVFDPKTSVTASTWHNFDGKRPDAYAFLDSQNDAMQARQDVKDIPIDPARRTRAQARLQGQVDAIQTARDRIPGGDPLNKLDFSELKGSIRKESGFHYVTDLETAQAKLIVEREAKVLAEKASALNRFENKMTELKIGKYADYGALFGAELVNVAVDNAIPTNRKSWATTVVDLAAPAVMVLDMSPLGRYEKVAGPLIKAGVIVGSHFLSHVWTDTNVPENGK